MRLRTKYLIFVVSLHLVTLVLTYFIFQENKVLFIGAEVFIIISVIISWSLYRQLIQPLKSLMTGLDAMKDQDFNVKFLPTGKYEVDQLIGVYNQMIDQLRTERTMQEQQHFFLEKLIHTSPTGIIVLDFEDKVQQINPKALQILGVSKKEHLDSKTGEVQHDLLKHITSLKSGEAKIIKDGGATTYKLQKSHFIDRGFSRHFVMIEELTAEILAAEKNVYGKVIRMMAHEVNNTVGPVNSIIQSALKTNGLWHQQDEFLREALQVAIDRNQNLNLFVRNFAELVKLPDPNKKQLELQQLVNSIIKLMSLRAKEKGISLIVEAPEKPFYIDADEEQMEQVLINIVKNAIEAIDGNGQVTFVVDASAKILTITDTGKGISAAESEHLFTPFYSTKKDGQGIGLTLVREILGNHGFDFSLKTLAANQTQFRIIF